MLRYLHRIYIKFIKCDRFIKKTFCYSTIEFIRSMVPGETHCINYAMFNEMSAMRTGHCRRGVTEVLIMDITI